jgi:hypothetical protein
LKPIRIIAYAFVVAVAVFLSVLAVKDRPRQPNIVDVPPEYSLDNMPRLGVDADYNFSDLAVAAAGRTGAGVMRAHLSWSAVEPSNTDPSRYVWGYYDRAFTSIAANGLQPIVVIDKCPAWACPFFRGPINPGNMGDFTEFVNAVVQRYRQPPYNARFWELFDEPDGVVGPNGEWNYGNRGAEYVQALRVLHDAAKSVDAEAVVMNGGLAYDYPTVFRPQFVSDTLAAGIAQYTDALNFHYFKVNGPGWTTVGDKAAELRQIMRNHGVDLPLVCTSTGESSANIAPWYSNEAQQARYIVKVNAQSAAAGIKSTTLYLNQDFYCTPSAGCGSGWEAWASHGLIRRDATEKPSHSALRVFAQEVGSGVFLGRLGPEHGLAAGMEGYHFGGSAEGRPQVSVVWNNSGGSANMQVPSAQVPALIRALGMSGQPLATIPGPNGTVLVSVGPDPVYIEWVGPRFPDVPLGSPFYSYIETLAQMGAVSGFVDGTFRPNIRAIRGHICKMIVLAHGWELETTGGPHFSDVPAISGFYPYVETAYSRGVISGYADGTFRPYNPITRGQLCKIITNARGWELVHPPAPTFADVPARHAFFTFVETTFAQGVVSGYADGTFRPGNPATRGQIAKIVVGALSSAE